LSRPWRRFSPPLTEPGSRRRTRTPTMGSSGSSSSWSSCSASPTLHTSTVWCSPRLLPLSFHLFRFSFASLARCCKPTFGWNLASSITMTNLKSSAAAITSNSQECREVRNFSLGWAVSSVWKGGTVEVVLRYFHRCRYRSSPLWFFCWRGTDRSGRWLSGNTVDTKIYVVRAAGA
jgi:hypothetical protein